MASYRNQCNLHLGYAKRLLQEQGLGDDWGGQKSAAMQECALFQCQIAYQCHLGDILDSYHLSLPLTASAAQLVSELPADAVYPELVELADKEAGDWAGQLMGHRFVTAVTQSIASTAEPIDAGEALTNLEELVARHRENLVEC